MTADTAAIDRVIGVLAAERVGARYLAEDIDDQLYRAVFGAPVDGDYRGEDLQSFDIDPYSGNLPPKRPLPRYTSTVDDARALLPGGGSATYRVAPRKEGDPYAVTVYDSSEPSVAPTLPLAICLAALRYRRLWDLHVGGDRWAEFRSWRPPMARAAIPRRPREWQTAISFPFLFLFTLPLLFILSLGQWHDRTAICIVVIGILVSTTMNLGLGRLVAIRRAGAPVPLWGWPFVALVAMLFLAALIPVVLLAIGGPGAATPIVTLLSALP